MREYVYKNPEDKGMVKVKLTTERHNELFRKDARNWKTAFEYYEDDTIIIAHKFISLPAKILITVLFPVSVLLVGVPEAYRETRNVWQQKKRGGFVQEMYFKKD